MLKWQIENNDASSIQLKLRTQVEEDAEIVLDKPPINGEHFHVRVCRFKSLKGLLWKLRYNRQCRKGASKNLGKKMAKSKRGPSPKKRPANTLNKHILDVQ
jgi:hypothetical protein